MSACVISVFAPAGGLATLRSAKSSRSGARRCVRSHRATVAMAEKKEENKEAPRGFPGCVRRHPLTAAFQGQLSRRARPPSMDIVHSISSSIRERTLNSLPPSLPPSRSGGGSSSSRGPGAAPLRMETGDQRKFGYGGDGGGECPSRVPRSLRLASNDVLFFPGGDAVIPDADAALPNPLPRAAGGGGSGDDGDGDDGWEPGGDGDSVRPIPVPAHSIPCQPTIHPTQPKQFPIHDTRGPLSASNRRAPSLPPPAPPAASHGPAAQHGGAGDPGGGGGVGAVAGAYTRSLFSST